MHESDLLRHTEAVVPITTGRPLSEHDIPMAVALNNYGMFDRNDNPPDHAPPPLTVEEMQMGHMMGNILEGAYSRDSLIGISWLIPQQHELYVNVLAVHPEFRDQGIGTRFLQDADRHAMMHKIPRLSLAVDPWNGRGVNAYLKHGYRIVDLKESYYGPDYPNSQRFKMVKQLRPPPQNPDGSEYFGIPVNKPDLIKLALSEGFVGVRLLRSESGDNRENTVIFTREMKR